MNVNRISCLHLAVAVKFKVLSVRLFFNIHLYFMCAFVDIWEYILLCLGLEFQNKYRPRP